MVDPAAKGSLPVVGVSLTQVDGYVDGIDMSRSHVEKSHFFRHDEVDFAGL
jgi:hypothetical protein